MQVHDFIIKLTTMMAVQNAPPRLFHRRQIRRCHQGCDVANPKTNHDEVRRVVRVCATKSNAGK